LSKPTSIPDEDTLGC